MLTRKSPSTVPTKHLSIIFMIGKWLRCLIVFLILMIMGLCVSYTYINPPSTLMLARSLKGMPYKQTWSPLRKIGTPLIASVLAGEDARFCNHHGIDWVEFDNVFDSLGDGHAPRGASTITMQTVKNLFLWSSRSYLRKILELPIALWADFVLSKSRILEIYLNIAELGRGIFGVEAAARHYFGIPAHALTWRQAALLATTLPNPHGRNPAKPSAYHLQLAIRLEKRAHQMGSYLDCLDESLP